MVGLMVAFPIHLPQGLLEVAGVFSDLRWMMYLRVKSPVEQRWGHEWVPHFRLLLSWSLPSTHQGHRDVHEQVVLGLGEDTIRTVHE